MLRLQRKIKEQSCLSCVHNESKKKKNPKPADDDMIRLCSCRFFFLMCLCRSHSHNRTHWKLNETKQLYNIVLTHLTNEQTNIYSEHRWSRCARCENTRCSVVSHHNVQRKKDLVESIVLLLWWAHGSDGRQEKSPTGPETCKNE